MSMEKIISRIIIVWILLVFVSIFSLYNTMNSETQRFYTFGPSDNFVVFGLKINTYPKYFIISLFCFMNSLIRTTSRDILIPWQTNSVQDITKHKNKNIHYFAYEVACVTTIYNWVDWYIYINLLLTQQDMIIIEISTDLLMSCITTRYYLNYKIINNEELERLYELTLSND